MSNRLLEVTVRPDWQEVDRQQSARGARLWREAQIAIIAAVLVSLLLGTVASRWPALQLVRLTLFTLVTWAPPLWFLIDSKPGRQRARQALVRVLAVLVIATAAAAATAPAGVTNPFRLPLPFALLIPATTWSLLLYERRQAPPTARALGFVLGDWFYYALAGGAAGVALGFHMLLITHYLPLAPAVHRPSPAELLWLFCYIVGLRATGEELLLRGFAFHLLSNSTTTILSMVARITVLNLLLYLMPLSQSMNPVLLLLGLVYGALLSVATTLLRYRAGSLVPALACNVAFTFFIAAVLPW